MTLRPTNEKYETDFAWTLFKIYDVCNLSNPVDCKFSNAGVSKRILNIYFLSHLTEQQHDLDSIGLGIICTFLCSAISAPNFAIGETGKLIPM